MTHRERQLFDAIIERLKQGGQAAAVSILNQWVKDEVSKNKNGVVRS